MGETLDGGQLSAQGAIDHARQQPVEAGEEALRPAEVALGRLVAQRLHDRGGDLRRRVHRHAERAVHLDHRAGVHHGAGGARRQVEHAHRAVGELAAQGLGEAAQTELARAVGREAGIADRAEGRADEQQHRARALAQQGQQAPGEQHRRHQVERNLGCDGLVVLLLDEAEAVEAGGLDHAVDAAKIPRRGSHRIDAGGGGEIGDERAQRVRKAPLRGRELVRVATDRQHLRARLAKLLDQRLADAPARAGDQHAASVQFHRGAPQAASGRPRKMSPYRRYTTRAVCTTAARSSSSSSRFISVAKTSMCSRSRLPCEFR